MDELNQTTRFTTDRFGKLKSFTDAAGKVTTYQRDADGLVTQMTTPDPDGAGPLTALTTQYEYDSRGNRTKITLPDGSTQTWTYDAAFSQPTSFTDELGRQTTYVVSATNGNTTSTTQPDPDGAGPLTAPSGNTPSTPRAIS